MHGGKCTARQVAVAAPRSSVNMRIHTPPHMAARCHAHLRVTPPAHKGTRGGRRRKQMGAVDRTTTTPPPPPQRLSPVALGLDGVRQAGVQAVQVLQDDGRNLQWEGREEGELVAHRRKTKATTALHQRPPSEVRNPLAPPRPTLSGGVSTYSAPNSTDVCTTTAAHGSGGGRATPGRDRAAAAAAALAASCAASAGDSMSRMPSRPPLPLPTPAEASASSPRRGMTPRLAESWETYRTISSSRLLTYRPAHTGWGRGGGCRRDGLQRRWCVGARSDVHVTLSPLPPTSNAARTHPRTAGPR
jgi:hypothetical protein